MAIRDGLPPKPRLPTPQVTADLDFVRRNALAGPMTLNELGITHTVELDWWEAHVHAGADRRPVEFPLTPAQHWSGRSLSDRNKTLWGGWAVLGADFHWYFTGDTGYSKDFKDCLLYTSPSPRDS